MSGRRQVRDEVEEERGLADPGLACKQEHRCRDDAAAEDAVEARPPRGDAFLRPTARVQRLHREQHLLHDDEGPLV